MTARGLCGIALMTAALSLAACHSPNEMKSPTKSAAPAAATQGTTLVGRHYVIDSEQSQALVLAYREGAMANLGHNHVIAVRQLSGSVVVGSDPTQSAFEMDFPVDAMVVDEAALRAAEGPAFQTALDEAAIAGTRDHMLGESLLDSRQYPRIHLQSQQIRRTADNLTAVTSIVVRAITARAEIPVMLQTAGDDLTASGEFDLTHAQLGLTPYSVALGALRVAERIHIRYHLTAHSQS